MPTCPTCSLQCSERALLCSNCGTLLYDKDGRAEDTPAIPASAKAASTPAVQQQEDADDSPVKKPNGIRFVLGACFLVAVIYVHVLTLQYSHKEGGLVAFFAWYFLALPLFLPGAILGLMYLISLWSPETEDRALRLILGSAVLILPLVQLGSCMYLPSGWRGG